MKASDTIDIEKENQRAHALNLEKEVSARVYFIARCLTILILAGIAASVFSMRSAPDAHACPKQGEGEVDLEKVCLKSRELSGAFCDDLVRRDRFGEALRK